MPGQMARGHKTRVAIEWRFTILKAAMVCNQFTNDNIYEVLKLIKAMF